MASAIRSEASAMQVEINVTPLIDVFLALVVILIIAAPLAMHRLPLPGDAPGGRAERSIVMSVLSTGELYLQGQAVTRAQAATTLAAEAAASAPPTLEICSDADTPYDKVVDALSLAQRSGLTGIAVKTCSHT